MHDPLAILLIVSALVVALVAAPAHLFTGVNDIRRALELERRSTRRLVLLFAFLGVAAVAGSIVGARHAIKDQQLRRSGEVEGWSSDQVQVSMARARRLIYACHRYKDKHGRFPSSLDLLVPEFVRVVETPATGNPAWIYSVYDGGQGMYLNFSANRAHFPGRSYASRRAPPWTFNE